MSYSIDVKLRRDYLHVAVRGTNTIENVINYLSDVQKKCLEHHCAKVLIEENLEGPGLSAIDIFNIIAEAGKRDHPFTLRIAYVDVNPEHDSRNMAFAGTVAVNLGVQVNIFSSVADAQDWLTRSR